MAASCVYASVSCNPTPHCVDWNQNNVICFGACHAVVIYDPEYKNEAGAVRHTLVSHKGTVNTVRWLRNKTGYEIISGSVDKTIVIWQENQTTHEYCVKEVLREHSGPVSVVKPFYLESRNDIWIASAAADSTLRIWCRKSTEGTFQCVQTLAFGNGFALDAAWSLLPGSQVLLLAVARDNSKIHLYVQDESGQFQAKLKLHGHEDWVSGLDFVSDGNGDLLLASCSQDTFVRLWRISQVKMEHSDSENDVIKLRQNKFTTGTTVETEYAVTLESVLSGHDNWVTSVRWRPQRNNRTEPELMSSSTDKSIIVWNQDKDAGLWLEKMRVGEVGGNTIGFSGAVFSPDGLSILANGHQGAFHLWKYKKEEDRWESSVVLHGHSQEVADLCWDPHGSFLLTCSLDQTARLHAPWRQQNETATDKEEIKAVTWHEVARPQIHGYDLWGLASLGGGLFASAGEEKIVRVFACTKNFVDNFGNITKSDYSQFIKGFQPQLPEGASVPSLGLSNKAVFTSDLSTPGVDPDDERHPKDKYPEHYFKPVTLSRPPSEDILLQNTLWPEIQKLYGHGYEVFSLAANHAGTLLASACKASKAEHACVILWETCGWRQVGQLHHHTLTITQMAFSPDDRYLLSVSRDRTWALYKRKDQDAAVGCPYERTACTDNKSSLHSRIIWSCAWSHNSKFFATSSRDKKVVVWSVLESGDVQPASVILDTADSATAVDFAPSFTPQGRFLLSIGLENGHVYLYTWRPENRNSSDWKLIQHLNETQAHHSCVKRIRFCPNVFSPNTFTMATCGSDHFTKVFIVDTSNE